MTGKCAGRTSDGACTTPVAYAFGGASWCAWCADLLALFYGSVVRSQKV